MRPIAPVDGVAVTYAETEAGPYTEASPTLTEAGTKQIWYVLKAPDWVPLTNSATLKVVKLVSDATVTKTLTSISYVYSGTAKRPSVMLKDTTAQPNLAVMAYSAGDVDGDGQLTENDITLIQRYNAYQKLSVEDKEKFPSYNLTGAALSAADVNKDGVVDASDVTTLRVKFSGYELIAGTDYTVAYSDNVNAGTGRVTITGKGNYGGSTVLEFTISKATLGESGEPGSGAMPSGGKSKYDVTCVYDGQGHTVNTNALSSLKIGTATPMVDYSLDGEKGWSTEPPVYTNAGQYAVWYRLRQLNYNDYVHEVQLTITPKPISDASIKKTLTPDSFVYDGTAKMPQETIVDESVFRWQFVAPYARGDVDGDGVLTQEDADAIDRYLSYLAMDDDLKPFFEEYALTGAALVASDYNGDGVVDEADMTELEASFVTLQKGVDYTITYKDNVNPGTATAIVSGRGNYGGTTTLTFAIVSLEIGIDDGTDGIGGEKSRFSSSGVYDGKGHGISVEVTSVANPQIAYSLAKTGPYVGHLLLTNACDATAIWYTVAASGYNTYTNWATVTITPRPVTVKSGIISKVYDGTPLKLTVNGITVDNLVAWESFVYRDLAERTAAGETEATFTVSAGTGTRLENYDLTTEYGTLTVTKASIGGGEGGGGEPGLGEIPEGGLSKFDATHVYDGEGHTINTQALYAVTLVGSTPSFSFSLDGETGWQNDPFVYTNVGEYVMWYKITAPNYEDYKHQAKVTIQPLVLTVTFDANGGSCPMASKTVTHGATYGTLPTPTWAGHIFAGWYTAASGGDEVKDSTAVSIMAPQMLYAHWVSVTGVSAKQRYPWNGLVDITVAFEGESNDVAKVDCSFIATNSATKAELSVASITRKGADSGKDNAWSRQFVWNAGADVGAVKIDDVALVVAARIPVEGGVQLWENGPYWAECNVGATKPEECGYYFMWGDTVGYKRNGESWDAVDGSKTGFSFDFGKCATFGEDISSLVRGGYVDLTGNLVAAYDAATAFLGAPWRMPTDAELSAIIDNCKILWTTQNRVCGCLVIGKGAYSSSRIFLPAAGYGSSSNLRKMDEVGFYWSSTLDSGDSTGAGEFGFNSEKSYHDNGRRELGQSIRPLRDPAASSVCVSKLHLSLDCRTGDRVSAGTEELTFSNLWDGDADATVTIAQDGAAIFTGLTGEGVKTWTVDRNGRYVLTHTTYKNGVKGKVETAVFVVEGKEVPVGELTIDWGQSSFVYDGQPKEPVITVKDRGTTLTKGTHYLVEYKDNINVGTAKAIVKGIEPYVGEMTNAFTITKGTLPPENPPDPIDPDPDDPQKPFSAFDYVGVYDGEGHTIDTNGLVEAFAAVVGGGFTVSYAIGESGGSGGPALPWTTVAPVFTNAATNVVWYKVSSANYADIVHAAKVAITKRAITVASVGATWTYDTTAHGTNEVKVALSTSGQETASPFPEGEGIEVDEASFPTITDVGEKDNAFEWAFAEGTFAGNYAVTVKYGNLKVNARPIGDDDKTWDIRLDKAPMYNGEVQSAPIIQVCYVKPDGNLDYIPYTLAGNTATDAGNYKVKITGTGNYTGTVEKDWAIMPRNLKMTSGTEEWMYDGETHSNDTVAVTGDGFVEGEGATCEGFPLVTHFADAAEPVENAFTYKLNENTKAKNYEIETKTGTVRMMKRPISLIAPTKSKTYDGTPLTFTAKDVTVGGEGYAEGEEFTLSNFASITEAGQTAATFTIADGTALMADYDITVTPGATLTVQKSATEITVTAKNGTWVYDGEEHKLHEYEATNLGTLVGGDRLDVTFAEQSVVTTPVDGENQDGVVENAITSVKVMRGDVDVSGNYTLAWYPGTLTVTKRPVTLTSKSASKTYDGTPLTRHEVDVGGDGFAGEDGATYTYTGTRTDKGKSKNTFEYALKSGTKAAYYEITKVEGELEIFAADISTGEEGDWEIVLGPSLTYNGIAQVQTITSVKYKGLDLDYTVTDNQQIDAGDYELVLTGQGNFTGTKRVAWKLNPKPITITAKSVTRPYDGNVLMSWNSTTEGMVPGEDAGAMTCTGNIKDVGSCGNAIAQLWWADNTKPSNYSVTKVAGTLTITPRPVTVTSKNITKPFDGTPLTLQSSDIYTEGIVIGEKFYYTDLASRTEAGQTSATFKIITLDNTKLTNYAITPVYGTITITKSATEIGVTARSKSWPYDAATHELHEYDATNLNILQPGEELVVTFKASSKVTTPKDGPDADGKVANEIETIRIVKNGTQDVTDNYTVTPYPGLLTVTKRPVTVTVEGETVSATYDGEEHTASGYDIATEDELYDIAAKTSFGGTDEVTRTDAGKSQMGLKPSDFTNSDEYFDVTYAVTDGWVSVAQADISAGEEGDFVLTLGANPKYNGTVQTIPVTAVTYRDLPVTYTLAGENATHAGTYTLTVKANGNFKGERSTTWRILKRQVKLTSGSASRAYDATPLANGEVAVSGDGFIGLEGATYSVTGAQTDVGSSKNAFTYALKAGTLAGDYEIATEQGDLTVTPRAVTLISASASKVYDATPLVKDAVSVKTGSLGFAGAEGFAATCSGTITAVGTTPNSFTYTLTNGAKAGNYAITTEYGTLTVTKATLDVGSVFPGFETCTEEDGFACTRVYNGKAQPFEVEVAESFAEEYEFLYAVTPGAWSPVAPTRTSVAEGALKVYFRFVSPNFEPYEGYGTLRIVEKEITDEMVQPGEDAFFFDGADKKPTVDVIYEVDGQDICTTNDYTLVYGEKAAAGWWVTVTGKGNYAGTVAKIVPVLKRPVAPPIVPSRSYNGKAQKPTIPTDSRWTTVSNPGGIDVGEYSNVVLRLTNTTDYKWKGGAEDQTDITLVFKVTKGNNGWSRQPDMKGWAYGETPSEPSMGQARYGTVQVAYRKEGADVSTETATRPELPGRYVARFWVDETENFIGVAVHEPYKDIAFEITGSAPGGTETTTTPVPVPHDWLDAYVAEFGGGDYETAANAKGRNGVSLWESYVAGLDPTDAASQFTAIITMGADGKPVITWQPDLRTANPPRTYVEYGKANLGDKDWTPVTDANRAAMRFFKVGVEIK